MSSQPTNPSLDTQQRGRHSPTIASIQRNAHVLEQTGRWTTALRRELPNCVFTRALSPEHLIRESLNNLGSVAVIEIENNARDLKKSLSLVYETQNHPNQILFIAVGGQQIAQIHRELAEFGFAAIFSDILSVPRLAKMTNRYWNSISAPAMSIEQVVESQLPWPKPFKKH